MTGAVPLEYVEYTRTGTVAVLCRRAQVASVDDAHASLQLMPLWKALLVA